MGKPLTAWSFSRWDTYDECPAKMKFKFIEKIEEPESAAMERGTAVHITSAQYLRGDIPANDPIPGWTYFEKLFRQLRELNPLVEQQWGFTNRWAPTGWFGDDTWFRSVLDAAVVYDDNTADVVDVKTGKPRTKKTSQQAELYAISILCRYFEVDSVTVRFWYVDLDQQGKEIVYRFSRAMLTGLLEKWTKRAKKMLDDRILAPIPGEHCKWCPYAKGKDGPCKYG